MPIFRAGEKLVYYAHVPKCGGSAVGWYLDERFGPLAFTDRRHTAQPAAARWSRTSPQHIDRGSLARLFPQGFFDAVFTIVRHPVARIVSAYHFQLEVEASIPQDTGFSDWLADLEEQLEEDPFAFDNHVRPMSDIVPEGAQVFHMEHGLDALVGWFDDTPARLDFLLVLAYDRMVPDAQRLQFFGRADPDGDVAPVPGNEAVGQAERRLLEQYVARAQAGTDLFEDRRLVVELALAAFDQADGVAEDHARQEHPLILEREDGIEPGRREEAG